jgi:uncharacterized delta-60 repeat protein
MRHLVSISVRFLFGALLAIGAYCARAADGDLDPTFGSGGQLLLPVDPFNEPIGATLVANDVVIQPDGKIVIAGYAAASTSEWIIARLNADGSYDHTFGSSQNGIVYYYLFGPPDNQAFSVALRTNGKIVVGGTIVDGNNGLVTAVAIQLNADGSTDTTWGNNGAVYFTPAAGASTRTRAIVLDTVDPYALGNIYLVGQYTHGSNNDFFYAGISPDGKTQVSNSYEASLGGNFSDSATSVAVQAGTGNIIVGGFATSAAGDVDCAAISTVIITNPAFKQAYVYTSWGTAGVARVHFNMGGDNNDFCDAMTLDPSGFMMLGGHGTKVNTTSGINYQSAITALFDSNGSVLGVGGGTPHDDTYAFTYDGQPGNGDFNTINRLLVDRYDTQRPTFMAVGHGFDSIFFPGTTQDFGLSRLIGFDGSLGTDADPSFNGGMSNRGGFSMIDYSACGQESCSFTSNDRAQSGAFDVLGRLVVVGSADDPRGGTDIAVARLKPFNGIFKNGFDMPSY